MSSVCGFIVHPVYIFSSKSGVSLFKQDHTLLIAQIIGIIRVTTALCLVNLTDGFYKNEQLLVGKRDK
jgi:hypothetical protein